MKEKARQRHENVKAAVTAAVDKFKAKSAAKHAKNQNTVTEDRLEMLVTVVARSKAEYYLDLLQSFEVNMQTVLPARGTADAHVLELFGLSDSDKAVIVGIIRENKVQAAFAALDEKFKTIKNGKGIAYTVPLTSVIGTLIFAFLSNNRMSVKREEKGQ